MLVSDKKYNSSPDMTRTGHETAALVFGKWEHAYTDKRDRSFNFGGFITTVTLTPSSPER